MARLVPSARASVAWPLRYGAALALTLAVVAARRALDPWLGAEHNRHLVFLPTVMLAAYLGGFGPGLLATVLSTLAMHILWAGAQHAIFHRVTPDLALFFLAGAVVSALIESLHRARARADEARASRERVMAIVAHDLRNPLGVIQLTSEMVQRTAADESRQRLRAIDRAASRMESLIRDLLDVTRIEHGELLVEARREEVDSIVAELAEAFAQPARAGGIALEVPAQPLDAALACDRSRLLQALSNLVGNALKFTPEGGRIAVRVAARADRVAFEVEDTGPGIAAEDLPRIFDAYWKGDAQGTGLGLFIAQAIVRAHGGELRVRSAPGRGACFSFDVPIQRGPRREAAPSRSTT